MDFFLLQLVGNHSVAAQMEWQKLQQQFYEDRKKKGRTESPVPRGNGGPGLKMPHQMPCGMPPMQGNMSPMQGNMGPMPPQMHGGMPQGMMQGMPPMQNVPGLHGPPPPYHQTTRSASVPIAVPSPAPGKT